MPRRIAAEAVVSKAPVADQPEAKATSGGQVASSEAAIARGNRKRIIDEAPVAPQDDADQSGFMRR